MTAFIPSCLKCLRCINDGQGSVLSCGHFCCDSCAYQPVKCPVCSEACEAESLLAPGPAVVDYIIPPAEAIRQVVDVLTFQDDHHSAVRRRFEEETSRHQKKLGEMNRMLASERAENKTLKAKIASQDAEISRLHSQFVVGPEAGRPPSGTPKGVSRSAGAGRGGGAQGSLFFRSTSPAHHPYQGSPTARHENANGNARRQPQTPQTKGRQPFEPTPHHHHQQQGHPQNFHPPPTPSPRGAGGVPSIPRGRSLHESPRRQQAISTPSHALHASTPRRSNLDVIPASPKLRNTPVAYRDMLDAPAAATFATPQRGKSPQPPDKWKSSAPPPSNRKSSLASPSSQLRSPYVSYSSGKRSAAPIGGDGEAGPKILRR